MPLRFPLDRVRCLLCLTVWAIAGVCSDIGAETLRVATYNVENYLVMNRRIDDGWRPAYPKTEREKRALRRVIRTVNPDVLALQEMGARPFLTELQRDLRAEGLDYPYAFLLEAEDEVRHVAVLTRVKPEAVHYHTDLDFPYFGEREKVKRGLLELEFKTGERPWRLFVVHFKSKWTERPDDPEAARRRTGEATAVRNRILERCDPAAGDWYLIGGDLNDTRDTPPVRRLLRRGAVTISEMIPATDWRGHAWTHHWERQDQFSRIDYLLASPAMFERVVGGRGYVYDGLDAAQASDHRMVWADFDFSIGPDRE